MKKIVLIIYFIIFCYNECIAKEYHFVSIEKLAEQEVGRLIIPEIYKKLGIYVTITPLPGKRAQFEASSGLKDGEIMRIWSYGTENRTVVRVPTAYYYLETTAFLKKGSNVVIKDKTDLGKYNVAKVRGVKHTNNITTGLKNVQNVSNTKQLMELLQSNRVQVALTNTADGIHALNKLGYGNIIHLKKPLAVLKLYHYLHGKNKKLVPKINNIIKKMKASGELKVIIENAEKKVFRQN